MPLLVIIACFYCVQLRVRIWGRMDLSISHKPMWWRFGKTQRENLPTPYIALTGDLNVFLSISARARNLKWQAHGIYSSTDSSLILRAWTYSWWTTEQLINSSFVWNKEFCTSRRMLSVINILLDQLFSEKTKVRNN